MKKFSSFICLTVLAVGLLLGCKTPPLESGGAYSTTSTNAVDIAVAAGFYETDLAYKVAWTAVNTVFDFEKNNRAYLWGLNPKIKHTLDSIRPRAVTINGKYLTARAAYLAAPSQTGLDTLHTVLADLQAIVSAVQVVLPATTLQTKG